jgi:antitoxin (DNA-binding transcriptional repressor) of toxin-antitoxin stability system
MEEAQARLPDIIHQLVGGDEIAVTEGDQVVARIVSERRPIRQRPGPGLCKGMMTIVADDDEHLNAFTEYMP